MTKFIKLTEVYRDGSTTAILLNCDFIKSIKISDKKTDTHVLMSDNKYFFVSESVEQIWTMFNERIF